MDLPDLSSRVRSRMGGIVTIFGFALIMAGIYEIAPQSWKDTGPRAVYHQVVSVATSSEDTYELRVSADRHSSLYVLEYLEDMRINLLASAIDAQEKELTAVLEAPDIDTETLEAQLSEIEGVKDVTVT